MLTICPSSLGCPIILGIDEQTCQALISRTRQCWKDYAFTHAEGVTPSAVDGRTQAKLND